MSNEMREAFEREFSVERNDKGFYPETSERLMWLACKFGYEHASLASKPQVSEREAERVKGLVEAKPVEVGELATLIHGHHTMYLEDAESIAQAIFERFNVTEKPPQEAKDEQRTIKA